MENKIFKLGVLAIFTTFIISCGGSVDNSRFDSDLLPVKNDKWQFINSEGEIIINPQFKYASGFVGGLAKVISNDDKSNIGYIDKKGKYKINANYISGTIFSDGLACVVEENSEPKYINEAGEVIFSLKQSEDASIFNEGLAWFSEINEEGKKLFGYINKDGEVTINPQFIGCDSFSNGLAAIRNDNGEWGYIDKSGTIIINPQFKSAGKFIDGMAVVSSGKSYGTIDKEGKFLINPQFDKIGMFADGLFVIESGNKYGFADREGKIQINPQFDRALPFSNGMSAVQSSGKWGFVDKEGRYIINPQFEFVTSFIEDFAIVYSGGKIGLVNEDGKYTVNPQFESMYQGLVSEEYIPKKDLTVVTDYFDAITILSDVFPNIEESSVNGISLKSDVKKIMEMSNISEDNISTYTSKLNAVEGKKVSKDAIYQCEIYFNSRLKKGIEERVTKQSYYGTYETTQITGYEINNNAMPERVVFEIQLTGKARGKGENLAKALKEKLPTSLIFNVDESNDSKYVFQSNKMEVKIKPRHSSVKVYFYFNAH